MYNEVEPIKKSIGRSAYRITKAPGCASNAVRNEIRRGTIELYHGSVKRYKASVGRQECNTEDIDRIGDRMNGLSRKGQGYRTPEELFEEQMDIIYRFPV